MNESLPWGDLKLISIDAGNTLFGMDYDWLAQCLADHGLSVPRHELERADFAARPVVSRVRIKGSAPPGTRGFEIYLDAMLERIEAASPLPIRERRALARDVAPEVDSPGKKRFFWSRLLPGVEEALRSLDGADLRVVLVSNSDGTVEDKLGRYGLRSHFDRVIDSAVVGVRKPDRRIFSLALEGFGVEPGEAVHVGDFYHSDVLGSRAAGLHAALIDPEDHWSSWDCYRTPSLLHLARSICGSPSDRRDGH